MLLSASRARRVTLSHPLTLKKEMGEEQHTKQKQYLSFIAFRAGLAAFIAFIGFIAFITFIAAWVGTGNQQPTTAWGARAKSEQQEQQQHQVRQTTHLSKQKKTNEHVKRPLATGTVLRDLIAMIAV